MNKKCFFEVSHKEIIRLFTEYGYEQYRIQQLYNHVFVNDKKDFNCFTLPKSLREILNSKYEFTTTISDIQKNWELSCYIESEKEL